MVQNLSLSDSEQFRDILSCDKTLAMLVQTWITSIVAKSLGVLIATHLLAVGVCDTNAQTSSTVPISERSTAFITVFRANKFNPATRDSLTATASSCVDTMLSRCWKGQELSRHVIVYCSAEEEVDLLRLAFKQPDPLSPEWARRIEAELTKIGCQELLMTGGRVVAEPGHHFVFLVTFDHVLHSRAKAIVRRCLELARHPASELLPLLRVDLDPLKRLFDCFVDDVRDLPDKGHVQLLCHMMGGEVEIKACAQPERSQQDIVREMLLEHVDQAAETALLQPLLDLLARRPEDGDLAELWAGQTPLSVAQRYIVQVAAGLVWTQAYLGDSCLGNGAQWRGPDVQYGNLNTNLRDDHECLTAMNGGVPGGGNLQAYLQNMFDAVPAGSIRLFHGTGLVAATNIWANGVNVGGAAGNDFGTAFYLTDNFLMACAYAQRTPGIHVVLAWDVPASIVAQWWLVQPPQ